VPALNLAITNIRLGKLDQALQSIFEAIKIAQNRNDHECILGCLNWLREILCRLGKKNKERKILEHILITSSTLSNPMLFSLTAINYAQLIRESHDGKVPHKIKNLMTNIDLPRMWHPLLVLAFKKGLGCMGNGKL